MADDPIERTATLLMTCKDQKGLVHRISDFIFQRGGNILHADQHIDFETGLFLSRVEWDLAGFALPQAEIAQAFKPLADSFEMDWQLRFSGEPLRTAIFVSKLPHCLNDLLFRRSIGELPGEFVAIISNHADLGSEADRFGIPSARRAIT